MPRSTSFTLTDNYRQHHTFVSFRHHPLPSFTYEVTCTTHWATALPTSTALGGGTVSTTCGGQQ